MQYVTLYSISIQITSFSQRSDIFFSFSPVITLIKDIFIRKCSIIFLNSEFNSWVRTCFFFVFWWSSKIVIFNFFFHKIISVYNIYIFNYCVILTTHTAINSYDNNDVLNFASEKISENVFTENGSGRKSQMCFFWFYSLVFIACKSVHVLL